METLYKEINFRTRLEARWAVFYDFLGIPFRYEREKMQPDSYLHPSYFSLPEQQMLVLIKGSQEDQELSSRSQFEAEAMILSERNNGEDIYTFFGQIPIVDGFTSLDYGDADNDSAHRVCSFPFNEDEDTETEGFFDHCYAWCECPECGLLDVQYGGRAARNKCGCLEGDKGNNCGSLKLNMAYEAARKATFGGAAIFVAAGYVYLIQAGPYYKIGKAKVVGKRIKQIKLQLPYPTHFVHSIEDRRLWQTRKLLA